MGASVPWKYNWSWLHCFVSSAVPKDLHSMSRMGLPSARMA